MRGIAFLTTLLMCGKPAQAEAQIIWSEKATELLLEYGNVIGKSVTEYAVKEYLDWLFEKKPPKADQTPPSANAKAVEDVVNRMSNDKQYLDKTPQAKQITSLLVASNICLGGRAGGDAIDACSIVIDSKSVSREDHEAAYDNHALLTRIGTTVEHSMTAPPPRSRSLGSSSLFHTRPNRGGFRSER